MGLLFLYEPLEMSLHDGVADFSWSDQTEKIPRLLIYIKNFLFNPFNPR